MGEYLRIQEMLREGESYAGLILGKDGEPDYHLVLLPEEASDVSWPTASEWAGDEEEQKTMTADIAKALKADVVKMTSGDYLVIRG